MRVTAGTTRWSMEMEMDGDRDGELYRIPRLRGEEDPLRPLMRLMVVTLNLTRVRRTSRIRLGISPIVRSGTMSLRTRITIDRAVEVRVGMGYTSGSIAVGIIPD